MLCRLASPSLFAVLLIVAERLHQPTQNFGDGFEHRPEARFVHLSDVFSEKIDDYVKALFHILGMVFGSLSAGEAIDGLLG